MKKSISLVLSLIFVLSCIVLPVSAFTPSPEKGDFITVIEATQPDDSSKITIRLRKADKVDEDFKPSSSDEKIISQASIELPDGITYPLQVKVKMDGIKTTSKIYALVKEAGEAIKKIEVTVLEDGVISFTLDKNYASIAFVADTKTATQMGVSDKTGDVATPAIALVLMASVAVVFLAKKKIQEN